MESTQGCWAGGGQAVPTTPGSPSCHGWSSCGHVDGKDPVPQRGNPAAARARLAEIKGAFTQQFQLLRSLLLQYLISTAERNNKLNLGFGWERLGPPHTFLLTEID